VKVTLDIDVQRGREAAALLYRLFSTTGIHGRTKMPEDILPAGVARGSLEHLLFITLTVAVDYQRDANALWAASRKTFEDADGRYLYDPEKLHLGSPAKIREDMQKHGLSKKPRKDAWIWRTVGVTFYKKWGGDPRNFLEHCGWDSLLVLQRLADGQHLYNERTVADYPYLRGPKIGPLWLRMLRDNVGVSTLRNLDSVPIPVDVHVARATLALGIVGGQHSGSIRDLFQRIREAWFQSVEGLQVRDRPMIALDVDEPLWTLSKYGCTNRQKPTGGCPVHRSCEMAAFCVPGLIDVTSSSVEVAT
jgi:hypothetical protein